MMRESQLIETSGGNPVAHDEPLILVVEDDAALRCGLMRALAGCGFRPQEACNGKAALAALDMELPDLILTDLIMPDQDGLELLGVLRKRAPSVRVIAMSGGGKIAAADYLLIARRMGAAATIEKPFAFSELFRLIAGVLKPRLSSSSGLDRCSFSVSV